MPYVLRPLAPTDLEAVCVHRLRMFDEAGSPHDALEAMAPEFRAWLEPRLRDGRYFGFAAEHAGSIVAGVGLMEIDWPPHPLHPRDARRGYVLNVYVEYAHRGRGVARALMAAADAEFRRRGLGYAILHATAAGRPLYERIGWAGTTEMAKRLPQ